MLRNNADAYISSLGYLCCEHLLEIIISLVSRKVLKIDKKKKRIYVYIKITRK